MGRRMVWLSGFVLGCFLFFPAPAGAEEGLAPGSAAPIWKDLPGVDDKLHSLDDLKDAKVVVVAFTCNSCPYSVSYEDRLIAFAKEYAARDVRLVAINVNPDDDDRLPKMKERAQQKQFPFPYLYDASQKIGRAYGAAVTPHLFVLDAHRRVAYIGAFDDARKRERVKQQYVRAAVEALLAGQKPPVAQTRATGCSIRYE